MNKKKKENMTVLLLLGLMAIFFMAFAVSETSLFKGEDDIHSFEEAVELQIANDTEDVKFDDGRTRPAKNEEIRNAMQIEGSTVPYQFLDLTETVDATAEEVDRLLEDKGILEGRGDIFLEAQEKHAINVLYLISHAQLETGNGTSRLAQGIQLEDAAYYNFFGIGAFDREAVEEGSAYAARAGWSTPETAILGGAEFISENYVDRGQETLYAMRWNPSSPGSHLYATDIEWALKIGEILESHYRSLGIEGKGFEKDYYTN